MVCLMVGLCCVGSMVRGHGGGAAATMAPEPPRRTAEAAATPPAPGPAEVDTDLPTGSLPTSPALRVPNPAAYAEAARAGSPLVLTGAEAINYLAGNTLRREGPGEPLHLTYFAARGVMGDGDERGFTARRWDRERPELCEDGRDGAALCRGVTIQLDGKFESPGARIGTVTLGAAGGAGPSTAVLVSGNGLRMPEHIPFLDSAVDLSAAAAPAPRGADPLGEIVGHPALSMSEADPRRRQVVLYAKDNRRLALQQVQAGDGRAVRVTVGHWRSAKGGLCETRGPGESGQLCFKPEMAADGTVRLAPAGRSGEAASLRPLPETGSREVAGD